MNHRFTCFVVGNGSLTIHCAEILRAEGHDLRGVVTSHPDVIAWTAAHGVPRLDPADDLLAHLRGQEFDYLFSIVNLQVLPAEIISLPRRAAINFHDGPLPRFAGVHATTWALLNGEPSHGITWHTMADRLDAGEILAQSTFPIADGETAFSLNTKCFEAGTRSFAQLVKDLAADTVAPRAQDFTQRSYFGMYRRPPRAALLSWAEPARRSATLVRALDLGPAPNPLGRAKVILKDQLYLCAEADVTSASSGAPAGTVLAAGDEGVMLATAEGALHLRRLQTLDGQPVEWPVVLAQTGLQPGQRLPDLDAATSERITAFNQSCCRHEAFWAGQLAQLRPAVLPPNRTGNGWGGTFRGAGDRPTASRRPALHHAASLGTGRLPPGRLRRLCRKNLR